MTEEKKSALDTAISESAKANNHSINSTAEQDYKELTLEDLKNSDLFYPIFTAFFELESAYYLAQEIQEKYFEALNPDVYKYQSDDNACVLWDFRRYRAIMWALSNELTAAYNELKNIGISRR